MGIIFKNNQFVVEKSHSNVKKGAEEAEILRRLRSFLDVNEPKLAQLLVNMWKTQGNAITYKELREAIISGDISVEYFEQWQQDYSRFVDQYLRPAWEEAIKESVKDMEERYPDWNFDPMADGVRDWTERKAASFVTSSTQTQIEGLRAVVRRAAVLENMSVDELARAIRPMVGLYYQQSVANLNYYNTLIQNGVTKKKALDLSIRYGARQHRYRGYLIARTELAFAYNQGSYEGTKQAQAAGYMGDVVKVWVTADDERVCETCGPLEGKAIAMDEDFDFNTKLATLVGNTTIRRVPPAHPSCRCGVMYKEIGPPIHKKE